MGNLKKTKLQLQLLMGHYSDTLTRGYSQLSYEPYKFSWRVSSIKDLIKESLFVSSEHAKRHHFDDFAMTFHFDWWMLIELAFVKTICNNLVSFKFCYCLCYIFVQSKYFFKTQSIKLTWRSHKKLLFSFPKIDFQNLFQMFTRNLKTMLKFFELQKYHIWK